MKPDVPMPSSGDDATARCNSALASLSRADDWYSLYIAMAHIHLGDLTMVADRVAQLDPQWPWLQAAVEAGGLRLAGFLQYELERPEEPVLTSVLSRFNADWVAPDGIFDSQAAMIAMIECALVSSSLPEKARIEACELMFRIYPPTDGRNQGGEDIDVFDELTNEPFSSPRFDRRRRFIRAARAILTDAAGCRPDSEEAIARYVRDVTDAMTWLDIYLALLAIPERTLGLVAAALEQAAGEPNTLPNLKARLTRAASDHPYCRCFGFAEFGVDPEDRHPVIQDVIGDCADHVYPTERWSAVGARLCIECAFLSPILPDPCRLVAADIGVRLLAVRAQWPELVGAVETLLAAPVNTPASRLKRQELAALLESHRRRYNLPRGGRLDGADIASEVQQHAEELTAAPNYLDMYLALAAMPDEMLTSVADHISGGTIRRSSTEGFASFDGLNDQPVGALLAAAAGVEGNRLAGFQALEETDEEHPALWMLLSQYADREGELPRSIHGRLAHDLARLGPIIRRSETRLKAARLLLQLSGNRTGPLFLEISKALLERETSEECLNESLDLRALYYTLLFHQYGNRKDLETAVDIGNALLQRLLDGSADPDWVRHLDNQALRLMELWPFTGTDDALLTAIDYGFRAIAGADSGVSEDLRAHIRLNQAVRLYTLGQASEVPTVRSVAIRLVDEVLALSEPDSETYQRAVLFRGELIRPGFDGQEDDAALAAYTSAVDIAEQRLRTTGVAEYSRAATLGQVAHAYGQRYRHTRSQADLVRIRELADEWLSIARTGIADRTGLLSMGATWLELLFEAAPDEHFYWVSVAELGSAVLKQVERFAVHPEGPDTTDLQHALAAIDARRVADNVVGYTALAWVRAANPTRAVAALESGSTSIVRNLAERIDWTEALRQQPRLAKAALDVQRDYFRPFDSPDWREQHRRASEYASAMAALRDALGLPTVESFSKAKLTADAGRAYMWLVATPSGGCALRMGTRQAITSIELPDLTHDAVASWYGELHRSPADPQIDAGRGRGRAAASSGPQRTTVELVLQDMKTRLGIAASWLNAQDIWLIPTGTLAPLPWQCAFPSVRLHVSAMLAGSHRQAPVPKRTLAVFCDAQGDLPGARSEGRALAELHDATVYEGSHATLGALGTCRASILHLALHGTPQPAIWFADGPLTLGNLPAYREMLSHLQYLTLNCCTSGAASQTISDETLSLATTALAYGVEQVLVALWPLDDDIAKEFALRFFDELQAGRTQLEALSAARAKASDMEPEGGTAAAYQLLG